MIRRIDRIWDILPTFEMLDFIHIDDFALVRGEEHVIQSIGPFILIGVSPSRFRMISDVMRAQERTRKPHITSGVDRV